MSAWLSLMLDRSVEVNEYYVLTQNSEHVGDEGQIVFPDLKVEAHFGTDKITVYCEHKWDSSCNHDQLRNYARCAQKDQNRSPSIVTFVGANRKQVFEARKLLPDVVQKVVYWEDIYRSFSKIDNPSKMLKEFIAFMAIQNIGSTPMDITNLRLLPKMPVTLRQLDRAANRLLDEFSWDFLDNRYRAAKQVGNGAFPCVINRFGRIGIEFMTDEPYTPAIVAGFLYDGSNHGVDFTRPDNGIDLLLRLEADPRQNKDCFRILDLLKEGRSRIAQEEQAQQHRTRVRVRDEAGNGNTWSLLIAQKCLADVIGDLDSETEQLHAIYDYFRQLITTLFRDPELERALKNLIPSKEKISTSEGKAKGWPHKS
ncbi:MAG TPA: hypothetical protein PKY50_18705 [Candidatus Competibacter sp.]|nr:hypothetical protein [Candidatus Competibacter sp.]